MASSRLPRSAKLLLAMLVPVLALAGTASPASASDPGVLAVEQQLTTLRYDAGRVDGIVDGTTTSAVMAFQKVHGLPRTGQVTPDVAQAILTPRPTPSPLVPAGGAERVEIDLTRQVLFLYRGNLLFAIVPVSSGTAATPTPTGSFRIYRQARGWETSRLGRLYNSQYIVGGIAIHGSLSVPAGPASHGCIRIPMSAAEWFPSYVSLGTPVYVLP